MNGKRLPDISRRSFLKNAALGAASLASLPILGCRSFTSATYRNKIATRTLRLNNGWLFGEKFSTAALAPDFNDTEFTPICLPHCVSKLSWQKWDPAIWDGTWIYRRHFNFPPEWRGMRVFLKFDGVMTGVTPVLNGHPLPEHLGGYLPTQYEITTLLAPQNLLAVMLDSRWSNVPPEGSPRGRSSIDYLEPGGIVRSARLEAVPSVFISDVFAKPVKVLDADRRLDVVCSVDAAAIPPEPAAIRGELYEGSKLIAESEQPVILDKIGDNQINLSLHNLGNVKLWDTETHHLQRVSATLYLAGKPIHTHQTRIGFRDARFETDGFFLNGKRLRLFGLDRHELFPYVGFAMPDRIMRQDAEMIRHQFNCNIVRCSHYPQTEAFLDACDELGLMVWEEVPGWQYLGDEAWTSLASRNLKSMICRDRNHPSVIIWGVRINESRNDPALYENMRTLAKSLDDSRPTSGSMTPGSRKNWKQDWHQDVFAFDDYHSAPDGRVGIDAPLPGVPYMLAEAVGQFSYGHPKGGFMNKYRRAGDLELQTAQALYHAQAHDKASAYQRCAGVIAWCAYDYGSLMNAFNAVKCPGIADIFRVPKLGATFYQAQVDPHIRPVIEPNFYWDFGPKSPRGPGKKAAIFSNCDRLELFINNQPHAILKPDSAGFPNLKYPPFFADLEMDGTSHPELRICGFVGDKLVLSRTYSSEPAKDQFFLRTDDLNLLGDGSDAIRLVFGVSDEFGAIRPFGSGQVSFRVSDQGVLVGDNPFFLADSGNVGAVWVKSLPGARGKIEITASHSVLGARSVILRITHHLSGSQTI